MQINQHISNSAYQRNCHSQNSTNFTSRKSVLRELDTIARITRREFPMLSNTYIERSGDLRNTSANKVYNYADGLVGEVRGFSAIGSSPNMRIIKSLDSMQTLRVGNCSEYAQAHYLAWELNGYKDVKFMSLFAYNPQSKKIRGLDHALVGVGFKDPITTDIDGIPSELYLNTKKGIVIDLWAGYTDFVTNATTNYKHDKIFGKLKDGEVLCYKESGIMSGLKRDDYLYLKHKYPNLVKSNHFSIKDFLRWLVMDKKQYSFDPIGEHLIEVYRFNSKMKGAKTRDEMTEFLTNDISDLNKQRIEKARLERIEQHSFKGRIKDKLKEFGRKFFK